MYGDGLELARRWGLNYSGCKSTGNNWMGYILSLITKRSIEQTSQYVSNRNHQYIQYICCAQTMDRDNPWIAPPKVWIRALRNNPWIVCSIHGSRERGNRSTDLSQTIDAWTLMGSGKLWLQNHWCSPLKHLWQQCCSTWLPIVF